MTAIAARLRAGREGAARAVAGLRGRLAEPGSLMRRAVTSSVWTLGGHAGQMVLRLGSNLILTRLLMPEAFAVAALILSLNAGLVMLSDLGMQPCAMRSPNGAQPRFLRTAWTMRLVQHAAISLVILAVAGSLALAQAHVDFGETIYALDDLPGVLALAAAIPLARGWQTAKVWLAMRRVEAHRVARLNLLAFALGTGVTVGLVALSPTVWSLVLGMLASALISNVVMTRFLAGPRMALRLDRRHVREVWDFGKWMMLASAFHFVSMHGDRLILSALLDARSLGFYALARIWVEALQTLISKVQPIVVSVLSEVVRTAPGRAAPTYARVAALYAGGCVAVVAGLYATAEPLLGALYTDTYAQVGAILQVMGLMVLWRRWDVMGSALLAFGDSRRTSMFSAATALATVTLIPIGDAAGGTDGVLLAVALIPGLIVPVGVPGLRRHMPDLNMAAEYALAAAAAALVVILALAA